jgi:hypothetical protein
MSVPHYQAEDNEHRVQRDRVYAAFCMKPCLGGSFPVEAKIYPLDRSSSYRVILFISEYPYITFFPERRNV